MTRHPGRWLLLALVAAWLLRRRRPVASSGHWNGLREDDDGIQSDAGLPYSDWDCLICGRAFPDFPAWREHVKAAHLPAGLLS